MFNYDEKKTGSINKYIFIISFKLYNTEVLAGIKDIVNEELS